MALSFRVRSFRNILLQEAAYFDQPEHTPGKLITRLASDAPNVKAVKINFLLIYLFVIYRFVLFCNYFAVFRYCFIN